MGQLMLRTLLTNQNIQEVNLWVESIFVTEVITSYMIFSSYVGSASNPNKIPIMRWLINGPCRPVAIGWVPRHKGEPVQLICQDQHSLMKLPPYCSMARLKTNRIFEFADDLFQWPHSLSGTMGCWEAFEGVRYEWNCSVTLKFDRCQLIPNPVASRN